MFQSTSAQTLNHKVLIYHLTNPAPLFAPEERRHQRETIVNDMLAIVLFFQDLRTAAHDREPKPSTHEDNCELFDTFRRRVAPPRDPSGNAEGL